MRTRVRVYVRVSALSGRSIRKNAVMPSCATVVTIQKKPVKVQAVHFVDPEQAQVVADWCGGEVVEGAVMVHTMEGDMRANLGSWVIKGVQGEFYPCDDTILRATYDIPS